MGREGSEEGGGEGKEERKRSGRWGGKRGEEVESEVGRKDMWLVAHYCILTSLPRPHPASHRLQYSQTLTQLPIACSTVNHTASDGKLGEGLTVRQAMRSWGRA